MTVEKKETNDITINYFFVWQFMGMVWIAFQVNAFRVRILGHFSKFLIKFVKSHPLQARSSKLPATRSANEMKFITTA